MPTEEDRPQHPTELARLTKAVDSLWGVKMELAAVEAASRAAEGREEVEGINHIVHRLYSEMAETVEIVAGVQKSLREREDRVGLELDEDGVGELHVSNEQVRQLASLALQACCMARRLVPSGLDPAMHAADELVGDVEAAVRNAFEASGLEREISDDFMNSVIDRTGSRLKVAWAVEEVDS